MDQKFIQGETYGQPYQPDDVRRLPLPSSERKIRDIPFCALFVLYWTGMLVLLGAAVQQTGTEGIRAIVYGVQSVNGQICGVDHSARGAGKEYSYLYWPQPDDHSNVRVCVKSCPTNTSSAVESNIPNANWPVYPTKKLYHFCIPACRCT